MSTDEEGRDDPRTEGPPPPAYHAHHVAELAALDRCEHGRHKADNCNGCPGGQSTGNLFLTPGQRIGTTLYGHPIIVPDRKQRWGDSFAWVPGDERLRIV